MSIRLKKVQWRECEDMHFADILEWYYKARCVSGTWYAECESPNEWIAFCETPEEAKAACEEHALERIREAVETVSPEPHADWWDREDGISTGSVNGIAFRIVPWSDSFELQEYDQSVDKFVGFTFWKTLEEARDGAIERAAFWGNRQASLDSSNSPEIPDGWRDISTAPRDGAWALVYMDGAVDCMYVKQGQQPQNWTEPRSPNVHPSLVTHWMPLPKPPKEAAT